MVAFRCGVNVSLSFFSRKEKVEFFCQFEVLYTGSNSKNIHVLHRSNRRPQPVISKSSTEVTETETFGRFSSERKMTAELLSAKMNFSSVLVMSWKISLKMAQKETLVFYQLLCGRSENFWLGFSSKERGRRADSDFLNLFCQIKISCWS